MHAQAQTTSTDDDQRLFKSVLQITFLKRYFIYAFHLLRRGIWDGF